MSKKQRWLFAFFVILLIFFLFVAGMNRLQFETDITKTLPTEDPVINDAEFIFRNNPLQSRIAVDIALGKRDPQLLMKTADDLKNKMQESGLFREVGISEYKEKFPELISYIFRNLPFLFTARELNERIDPLLSLDSIRHKMNENLNRLSGLEGIGQAEFISQDPLEFKNIVLEKLKAIAPAGDVIIREGYILTKDREHLLIVAVPASPNADTSFSKKLSGFFTRIDKYFKNRDSSSNNNVIITPVGAYRASLDNEVIAKRDIRKVLVFTTLGIILLLLVSFPRPYLGVLALVPAISGSVISLFVYSLIFDSLSYIALGFGGAIISITVDHGIVYLLFLDRPHETSGKKVAGEVKSIGLLAVITSVGAFGLLTLTGFRIFREIGVFAAMGIFFSFVFIHTVFPLLFPSVPPAKKKSSSFLLSLVKSLFNRSHGGVTAAALVFFLIMLIFSRPEFNIDIEKMNTVSPGTLRAEKLIKETWGNQLNGISLMIEGDTLDDIFGKSDRLIERFNTLESGTVSSYFLPSSLIPGKEKGRRNREEWGKFWSGGRMTRLKHNITIASKKAGFAPGAFDGFFKNMERKGALEEIPGNVIELLGIRKKTGGGYLHFSTLIPGPAYQGEDFFARFSRERLLRIFDARLFTGKLGAILSESFGRLLGIIGVSMLILLLLFFMDIKLVLIAVSPILFSLVSTLGTLGILGRGLDIPALMLAVVVLGMGIDYSVYYIRAFQKYRDRFDTSRGLVSLSIVLTSCTTLIGFGVLLTADHSMFVSAGLTSFLGIAYAVIGTFTLQPYLLRLYFSPEKRGDEKFSAGSRKHHMRTLRRYRGVDAYPRLFARFKIMLDPMFPRLGELVNNPEVIIDVGCGFGVPSAWLMELYPGVRVHAIEPDPQRAEIASTVFGNNGTVEVKSAPELLLMNEKADTALLLDMIHYLTHEELRALLKGLDERMGKKRKVVIRVTIPTEKRVPWERTLEITRLRLKRADHYFRSLEELTGIINGSGFQVSEVMPAARGREEIWIIAG